MRNCEALLSDCDTCDALRRPGGEVKLHLSFPHHLTLSKTSKTRTLDLWPPFPHHQTSLSSLALLGKKGLGLRTEVVGTIRAAMAPTMSTTPNL